MSRRIEAPPEVIFAVLADPGRHLEIDGSEMLRGPASDGMITGVGDVFVMRMHYSPIGDYDMNNHVVEYEQDRRIGWEPEAGDSYPGVESQSAAERRWGHRWSYELTPDGPGATIVTESYDCSRAPEEERANMDNGRVWRQSMAETLERLERACTGQPASAAAESGAGEPAAS
ncbi:MAG TPA: SRPBCC family protein [Streptosporangiaceae bacterium]|nr:SRPBCC family protein [Streptosporangiaceae bacterium]